MNRTRYIYGRVLFTIAATWNLAGAAMLIFNPDFLLVRLEINDSAARLLAQSFASSVSTWGIGYALIAFDQQRFRDFAWLGVISKTLFFLIYFVALLNGRLSSAAFVPAVADLLFAMLFLEFLLRAKQTK
jgi:hypothetical protein